MARPIQQYSPSDLSLSLVLLVSSSGMAGNYADFNLRDGSINYFGFPLRQSFQYNLIDNIGIGYVRICYNRPDYNLSLSILGSKTLGPGDALYIEEDMWHIRIYYISPSTVELVLKSDKSGGYGL
jgi:hypothetical protein